MATTYTRRINPYVNNREAQNDIVSIRLEHTQMKERQRICLWVSVGALPPTGVLDRHKDSILTEQGLM